MLSLPFTGKGAGEVAQDLISRAVWASAFSVFLASEVVRGAVNRWSASPPPKVSTPGKIDADVAASEGVHEVVDEGACDAEVPLTTPVSGKAVTPKHLHSSPTKPFSPEITVVLNDNVTVSKEEKKRDEEKNPSTKLRSGKRRRRRHKKHNGK